MTPEQYRALKKEQRKFKDGEEVKGLSDFTGKVKWSRWEPEHCEYWALVVSESGQEEMFWHSELSSCDIPST